MTKTVRVKGKETKKGEETGEWERLNRGEMGKKGGWAGKGEQGGGVGARWRKEMRKGEESWSRQQD